MKIHIVTVGEPKMPYAQAGFNEYIKRLNHYHKIRLTHIADKNNNAEHFIAAIGQTYSVAMVIDGTQLTSPQLATFIEQRNQDGREVTFLIGGPDGLPASILEIANQQLSFSRLTFPHDLAMLVLAEALYRASTIAAGHPYHR